ncbi:hypothetical protein MKW94_006259 [Papaver nudicaule]|uniref:Uncharacterized protein n=1 Tax=Papaver nudicaule TaxID=74823 RepID=A0AA41V1S5_PAPNU|nr:hypothetical protein [Papaver nudicaule]
MNNSSHISINNQISQISCSWTREQEKQFERGIIMFLTDENDPNRWHKVASYVGDNKTAADVYQHYQDLVRDIKEIEEGRVELPSYYDGGGGDDNKVGVVRETTESELAPTMVKRTKQQNGGESERKKGIPWTEEEHRAFLYGLEKYGKGDWRSISRNAVQTRTPTQVASHAQKYFLRLNAEKKERKRSSIHDITTVEKVSKVSSDRPVQRMKTIDSLLGSFPRQGDYFGCH